MFGNPRTGVRFVLTNTADTDRIDDFDDWYDAYETALTRIGHLANAFRFDGPANEQDGRFAAIYDIITPDPATAWPATESSADYPTRLFEDPRSRLVIPVFRASYALVGSAARPGRHSPITGVHVALSDGGDDTTRQLRAARALESGLFTSVSRFRAIEGLPEPPAWLEIFETDDPAPLTAYSRLTDNTADPAIRFRTTGSYRLTSVIEPAVTR
jgi:hypothetical protein